MICYKLSFFIINISSFFWFIKISHVHGECVPTLFLTQVIPYLTWRWFDKQHEAPVLESVCVGA